MLIPPLTVLASWPKPNHVNPESLGPAGIAVGSTFIILVTIILILRLYTRRWISKGFGLDDVLIICAYFPALAFTIAGIIGATKLGWGKHVWDVPLETTFIPAVQTSLVTLILFDAATSLTKLSMLAMLYKLTSASGDKKMNVTILILSALISLNAFIFLFIMIFQCKPISAYWTPSLTPQDCIDEGAHINAAGIINTVSDFILVFLPIRPVMALKLPTKQRLIVLAFFSAGFVACIAGVVRVYLTAIAHSDPRYDRTWDLWAVWIASAVELGLGIICASIPAIRPFFARYLPSLADAKLLPRKQITTVTERSTSRWSYDIKGYTRRIPALIKHKGSAPLEDAKPDEDKLGLLPTFRKQNQQHTASLKNTSMSIVRPLTTLFQHKHGESLPQEVAQPNSGDEPKAPLDINKPLPIIRRSLDRRPISYPTSGGGIVPAPLNPLAYHPTRLSMPYSSSSSPPHRGGPFDPGDIVPPMPKPAAPASPSPSQQQRDGVRFTGEQTRLSKGPREGRETVVIMYKSDDDEEP